MRTLVCLVPLAIISACAGSGTSTVSGRWTGCDDASFESDSVRVTVHQTSNGKDRLIAANTYSCQETQFSLSVDRVIAPELPVDVTVERLSYSVGDVISTKNFTGVDLFNQDADLGGIAF